MSHFSPSFSPISLQHLSFSVSPLSLLLSLFPSLSFSSPSSSLYSLLSSAFISHWNMLPSTLSLLLFAFFTPSISISSTIKYFRLIHGVNYTVFDVPEGPTSWADEEEMRDRMAQYAKEKFNKNYHDWGIQQEKKKRSRLRRDGGLLSGPVATAIVTGMIGMTARTVQDLANFHTSISDGGCNWFGTAPLCNYPCPPEYDYIRKHNGRCSAYWLSGFCAPDESFGKPCTTILGDYFYKRFCCKSDPTECTWSGRWMGANTAHNIYCRYDVGVGRCGSLDCSINHHDMKAQNSTEITGERCDKLELFGLRGKATCGYVAWFDETGDIVNSWYKTK